MWSPPVCLSSVRVKFNISECSEKSPIQKGLKQHCARVKNRHRQIVEASTDAILVSSGDVIIYANPAAPKLFRASHIGELVGKRYLDLVHPDDRAESTERIKKGINNKWIAPPREHRMVALDGQVLHVESTGVPIQYQGETQLFGAFRDITERKQMMKSSEKLKRNIESLPNHFLR